MTQRYKAIKGSGHTCCFESSVVDTDRPEMVCGVPYVVDGEPRYEVLCECFDEPDAKLIAEALNARGTYPLPAVEGFEQAKQQFEKQGLHGLYKPEEMAAALAEVARLADALTRAKAEGVREGLEEAAKETDRWVGCDLLAAAIRQKAAPGGTPGGE